MRPGDVVRLNVWREPDLTGEFPVDEAGSVVLPLIGPMSIAGESPVSLRTKLVSAYGEHVNHSAITVTLLRRVQVLGAVRNPGLYNVDATMTLGDVLAQAGGITTIGNEKKLQLLRRGVVLPVQISRDLLVSKSPISSGDLLFVPERSWPSRYPGIVAAVITAGASLAIALARSH